MAGTPITEGQAISYMQSKRFKQQAVFKRTSHPYHSTNSSIRSKWPSNICAPSNHIRYCFKASAICSQIHRDL